MAIFQKLLSAATVLAGAAIALPAAAQNVPDAPDVRVKAEEMIYVVGAVRDPAGANQAEDPADSAIPELPVVYEGEGPAPAPAPTK